MLSKMVSISAISEAASAQNPEKLAWKSSLTHSQHSTETGAPLVHSLGGLVEGELVAHQLDLVAQVAQLKFQCSLRGHTGARPVQRCQHSNTHRIASQTKACTCANNDMQHTWETRTRAA